ncbi:MBL fold metallo-hydrolase [Candidatus Woesearchaeota archaeon]|nr:MBL fold metallo-hydrolase [Candidatus Woesearchaeota archaeon]
MVLFGNVDLSWLGHSGFKIKDTLHNRVLYVDPFKIGECEPADAILLTHSHYNHCSIEDIKNISTPKTVILAPADCQSKFRDIALRTAVIMSPGRSITMGNINIEAIPAYNNDKEFHQKDNGWLGYVIDINSKRIYHSGDSDFIKEMTNLNKIDIALMPVSGKFVMTAKEAAEAVASFEPKLAIPMHYGEIIGDKADAEKFKELSSVPVEILEKE